MNTPQLSRSLLVLAGSSVLLTACDPPQRERISNTTAAVNDSIPATNGFRAESGCGQLPDAGVLKRLLNEAAAQGEVGGLFEGKLEWGAIVNRMGELCVIAVAPDDPTQAWAGSEAIAKAKAFTANAFSNRSTPLSTARLYTLTQPGHSLWGLSAGNPFNIGCLSKPTDPGIAGLVCGGTITFGGGVALYADGVRVGGLGVSGDTPCADHEIAEHLA